MADKVADQAWYRGNTFNPRARGVPQPQSHVSPLGNVTPEGEERGKLPGWLIRKFAEQAELKRQFNLECLQAGAKLKAQSKLQSAEDFLRSKGCRLDRKGYLK